MNGLAPRFDIRQTLAKDEKMGVHFEIEREGHCLSFDLSEADALAVALAILDVSIQIRDGSSIPWRPRLVGRGAEVIPPKRFSS